MADGTGSKVGPNAWARGRLFAILFVCSAGLCTGLFAQEAGTPQATPASKRSPTTLANSQVGVSNPPTPDPKAPKDDRILWALPNYLTVENAPSLPPLTAGQKFKLIAKDTFDPVTFAFIGIESGLNQATNSNPTFGQGLKGYAKRYGLAFADNAVGNFMSSAVFPVALHQDPRFYQMGSGGFLRRFWYAGTRVAVTRSDAGKSQANYSEIFGNAVAAGISNAYHPGPRTLGSNINIWATQIAWDAVSYEMKEFWPDLHHRLAHKH